MLIGTRPVPLRALPVLCLVFWCAAAFGQNTLDAAPAGQTASGKRLPPAVAVADAPDAQQRFQQGLRLATANKTDAAIKMFSGMTVDYPLLPQPYVQLAALYVQQGDLTRASNALHAALERKLDDAVLQERLGDLYLELARQSYRQAMGAVNPSPAASEKYAALQTIGSRTVKEGSVQP